MILLPVIRVRVRVRVEVRVTVRVRVRVMVTVRVRVRFSLIAESKTNLSLRVIESIDVISDSLSALILQITSVIRLESGSGLGLEL